MRHLGRTTAAVAIAAALLALAPSALAATPFQFALGKSPDLAVDTQGTAHIVWINTAPPLDAHEVRYCRVPRGQRACQGEQVLLTGRIFARPHVFLPSPGEVVVAASSPCSGGVCQVYRDRVIVRRSTDGGQSFGPPATRSLTVLNQFGLLDDAVFGPGASITGVSNQTSGVYVINAPLSGPLQQSTARIFNASSDFPAIGLDGARPVVAFHAQSADALMWSAYSGAGNISSPSSWTPPATLETNASNATMAGGPSGLFLMYTRSPFRGPFVRKFTGTGWTNGVRIGSGSVIFPDLSQDASGRLHAIWVQNGSPDRLLWRTSKNGVDWGPTVTIDIARDSHFPELHGAAAPDGRGFAVWDARGGPTGAVARLMATPLEPFTGSGSNVKKGDSCKWPNCLPAPGGKQSASVGGKRVTLGVRIASCSTKRVTIVLRGLKRRMGRRVVERVVFRLGKRRKTDRRPAYRATYRLGNASANKRFTVSATIRMRIGGKRTQVKLSKRFFACPLS